MIVRTSTYFPTAAAVLQTAPLEFEPAVPAVVDSRTPAIPARVNRTATPAPVRRDGPAGRFYEIGDQLFPSVTHVLTCLNKPALVNWAADQERTMVLEAVAELYTDAGKVMGLPRLPTPGFIATLMARLPKQRAHQRALAKAGDIGKQAHALIERSLRHALGLPVVGAVPTVSAEAAQAFRAFQAWARSVNLKPKHIEQIVYSRTHQFAGTLDLVADVDGREVVIDFKTGKAIYPEAYLQNVAYQEAYAEMGHGRAAGGLVVRLPKRLGDPSFEVGHVPACATLYPSFLAVRQVWTWWHAQEEAGKASRRAAAMAARTSAA